MKKSDIIKNIKQEILSDSPFVCGTITELFDESAEKDFSMHGNYLTDQEYWERNFIMNLIILEYFDV